jgi:hypothetical protein
VPVSKGGFRSDQILTILVSIDFNFVGVHIANLPTCVGLIVTAPTIEASSLASTICLPTLVFEVLGSLSDICKELRWSHISFGTMLLWEPVTMFDRIKDPLAVVLMVEELSTATTTSAEPTLTSLLPRY